MFKLDLLHKLETSFVTGLSVNKLRANLLWSVFFPSYQRVYAPKQCFRTVGTRIRTYVFSFCGWKPDAPAVSEKARAIDRSKA
jgi:hypothetical protein